MTMNLLLESSLSWLWSNSNDSQVSVTAQGRDAREGEGGERQAAPSLLSPPSPRHWLFPPEAGDAQGAANSQAHQMLWQALCGTQAEGGGYGAELGRISASTAEQGTRTAWPQLSTHACTDRVLAQAPAPTTGIFKCCLLTQHLKTHWQQQETKIFKACQNWNAARQPE